MKKIAMTAALTGALVLVGCKGENGTTAPVTAIPDSEAVAKVNGSPISKRSLEMLSEEVSRQTRGMEVPREKLIEELVQRELLVQEAKKKKLESTQEVAEEMAFARQNVLFEAAIQDFLSTNEVSDAELKQEYDRRIGAMQRTEYKARHILTKTEDEAKKVIKKLAGGGDFAELAKKNSTGPSAPKGGDLGWFSPQQMVQPFSDAVIALKDGEYTKQPVQTQFGWHVILREGSREQAAPPFDAVKEQLKPMLQRQKLQDHIAELKEQANIEVLETAAPETAAEPAEGGEAEPAAPAEDESPAAEEQAPAEEGAEKSPEAP